MDESLSVQTGVKRSQFQLRKPAAQAVAPVPAKTMLKSLTYQPPLPVKEPVRLLSDAVPALKAVLIERPPFQIKMSDRLSASIAAVADFPEIDSLFRLRAGSKGQRRRVRHEISESVSSSEASPGDEEAEQEYYFENIDVRNDLIKEASAVLSSLSNAQVSAGAHAHAHAHADTDTDRGASVGHVRLRG